jgi:hypothetical protein
MDANAVLLIVVAIVLVGSAIGGWRGNRQKREAGREQRGELLRIEGGGMSPTIPSVMKVMTLDGARSIDPGDIGHVMPHRRDGETCYATLMLRSSEKLTGLVATADIDALLSDWLARPHAKIQPELTRLVHWQVSTGEQGTLTKT